MEACRDRDLTTIPLGSPASELHTGIGCLAAHGALVSRTVLEQPPPLTPQEHAWISLGDAFLRLERAGVHLAEVKTRIDRYIEAQKDTVTAEVEDGLPQITFEGGEPPPRMLSIVIGDTIQNLRTALDYLLYALAWLDSGGHQPKTQFPIESRSEGFKGRRSTYLKGVSDEHVAAIKRLQPFSGTKWSGVLAFASNQDKHWALHLAVLYGEVRFSIEAPVGDTGKGPALPSKVEMDGDLTIDVAFPGGALVMKSLEILEAEVRGVLESFKPEFEQRLRALPHSTPPAG